MRPCLSVHCHKTANPENSIQCAPRWKVGYQGGSTGDCCGPTVALNMGELVTAVALEGGGEGLPPYEIHKNVHEHTKPTEVTCLWLPKLQKRRGNWDNLGIIIHTSPLKHIL